jgi:nucleotide-binding universal stress UspA family protein
MKKILVPIDFSDYSINAFRLANYIAKTKGMSIKLLHLIEESKATSGIPFFKKTNTEYLSEIETHTTEHLKRIVSLEKANGVEIFHEVRRTKEGISKEILKEECDVIIMGRKRLENDEVLFAGSVAEKVGRLSSIPVMTVGDLPQHGLGIRNIVFASDFEDPEQGPIIQRVIDLANIFRAQLHFLYVSVNRKFLNERKTTLSMEYLVSKFDLKGHDVEVYFAETPEEGIMEYIQNYGIDLLTMCTHGRNGFASFFTGSISENMAAYASVPVLTYNINKKTVDRASRPLSRDKIILRNKSGEKIGETPIQRGTIRHNPAS